MFRKVPSRSIQLYISDCAGTLIDKNSRGPVVAMQKMFKNRGFVINEKDIRQFMGLPKKLHLLKILELPNMSRQFKKQTGEEFYQYGDIHSFLQDYEKEQVLLFSKDQEFTTLLPGARNLIDFLHRYNSPIALTTGYNRTVLNIILQSLHKQGFVPDFHISSTEASSRQLMNEECLKKCKVDAKYALAIGDTLNDCIGAVKASIRFCGIENKYCSKDEFQQMGATYTLEDVEDVKHIW